MYACGSGTFCYQQIWHKLYTLHNGKHSNKEYKNNQSKQTRKQRDVQNYLLRTVIEFQVYGGNCQAYIHHKTWSQWKTTATSTWHSTPDMMPAWGQATQPSSSCQGWKKVFSWICANAFWTTRPSWEQPETAAAPTVRSSRELLMNSNASVQQMATWSSCLRSPPHQT